MSSDPAPADATPDTTPEPSVPPPATPPPEPAPPAESAPPSEIPPPTPESPSPSETALPPPESAPRSETAPTPMPGTPPGGRAAVDPPTLGALSGSALLKIALSFYGVVALFAVGYALFSGTLATLLGTEAPTLPHLVGALGLGLALVVLTRIGARAWAPMARMRDAFVELSGPLDARSALGLAALSSVAEELLFRGALWPHLGLIGTTLLFGLVHTLPRRSLWVYPLFATLAGLLLGLLREGTGSIWPPMLAHFVVNAVNLIWLGSLARQRLDDRGVSGATDA